jgi:hypothetical protein
VFSRVAIPLCRRSRDRQLIGKMTKRLTSKKAPTDGSGPRSLMCRHYTHTHGAGKSGLGTVTSKTKKRPEVGGAGAVARHSRRYLMFTRGMRGTTFAPGIGLS